MMISNNAIIGVQSQYARVGTHTLDTNSLSLDSWIYRPPGFDIAADESLPVLVFFHGTGAQAGNANSLLTVDAPTPTSQIDTGNYPHNIVTISPFKPSGDWDRPSIAGVLQSILDNRFQLKIDPTRIFLTGLSLGAIGISGYVFLQGVNDENYIPIRGIFPMSGGSSGVGAVQAQQAIDKNILIRGWLGDSDTEGFANVMTTNETQTNALSPDYYELNTIVGGTHSPNSWGVPYSDNSPNSIYDNVLESTSSNTIPTNVIERYAIRRFRFDVGLQQDGTTAAGIGDAVYEFRDFSRFGRFNLVWSGFGTPPVYNAAGYVEIGNANDIEWDRFQLAPIAQPSTLWWVMDDLAGQNFDVYLNSQGAIIQANGTNLRVNSGTNGTFAGVKPPDGSTSIFRIDLDGANSEVFLGGSPSASNPQNTGSNKVTLIRIGTSGTNANWRFREMFFTPQLDSTINGQIFNGLNASYP